MTKTLDNLIAPLTLSDFNDQWNKMALGISDSDVPSRPRDDGGKSESHGSSAQDHRHANKDRRTGKE